MLPATWALGAAEQSLVHGAVLPAQSPASHFQGDSSFVVMTNFIVTPHQSQGYCAEVRLPNLPPPSPQGESHQEEEVPLGTGGEAGEASCGGHSGGISGVDSHRVTGHL